MDTRKIPVEPLSPQLTYEPSPSVPQTVHYQSRITGIKHCLDEKQYEEFENTVFRRESVRLIPEPENQFDGNAIAAYTADGVKCGYIAREETAMIRSLMEEPDFKASLFYMDFMAGSAKIEITVSTSVSLYLRKLFCQYTPFELCKANYLYLRWGGIPDSTEEGIFSPDELSMDFDRLSQLELMYQDRLAQEWEYRMGKATVENPDRPKARMSVPLDLSVYGTSWKDIDLHDTSLIDLIETENKMLALYIRMRRKGINLSPEECNEQMADGTLSETVLKRMHFEYDNNRL